MKHYYLFLIAAVMVACNQPDIPKPIPGAKADFKYTADGLYCLFSNTSTDGLRPYHWDFGDGGSGGGADPIMHKYSESGTYNVTLTCYDNFSYQYKVTKPVTISTKDPGTTDPTDKQLYFCGFKFYTIPSGSNGYLFRCVLSGHDLMDKESLKIDADYTTIYNSFLPYTINVTPILIASAPDPFDYYKDMKLMVVYKETESSSTYNVYTSDLNPRTMTESENIVTFTNGMQIGLLFRYNK